MKSGMVLMGALAASAWLAGQAQAFGICRDQCTYFCQPTCITWVEKPIIAFKAEFREEKVPCTIPKITCRVEVVPVKCTVMVPKFSDEKRSIVVPKYVPRLVETTVTRCKYVPVKAVNPCTGCCYTCFKPQMYQETVKCTVFDTVMENRDVVVKVCHMVPEERVVQHRHVVRECKNETVMVTRRYCVMVPYQTTVRVPVCVPCPPPAPKK